MAEHPALTRRDPGNKTDAFSITAINIRTRLSTRHTITGIGYRGDSVTTAAHQQWANTFTAHVGYTSQVLLVRMKTSTIPRITRQRPVTAVLSPDKQSNDGSTPSGGSVAARSMRTRLTVVLLGITFLLLGAIPAAAQSVGEPAPSSIASHHVIARSESHPVQVHATSLDCFRTVVGTNVNVRAEPSTSAGSVGQVHKGTRLPSPCKNIVGSSYRACGRAENFWAIVYYYSAGDSQYRTRYVAGLCVVPH